MQTVKSFGGRIIRIPPGKISSIRIPSFAFQDPNSCFNGHLVQVPALDDDGGDPFLPLGTDLTLATQSVRDASPIPNSCHLTPHKLHFLGQRRVLLPLPRSNPHSIQIEIMFVDIKFIPSAHPWAVY